MAMWLLLLLPGLLAGLYAQFRLTATYNKYSEVPSRHGLSGAEAAREILDQAGLRDMDVVEVQGHLTDHYDPMKKALFLSSDNFHGRSLAAVGVAAHEAGHALQHQAAYVPLHLRMALVPITNFASTAAFILTAMGGMIFHFPKLALVGVVLFSITTFFQLVTLPVEYDASRRAKERLLRLGLVQPDEGAGVSKVLNAAGLTYVAAMVASVAQLLQFLLIARQSNRD